MKHSFLDFLESEDVEAGLESLLENLSTGFVEISEGLRSGKDGGLNSENATGDHQIAMDIYANDILVNLMKKNKACALIGSEELDEPLKNEHEGQGYAVFFDPLDGSSIADMNLAVGTIVGIYKGAQVLGKTGREQVAAVMALYGTRLTFLVTLGKGVYEFLYVPLEKEFVLLHGPLKMQQQGKIMAPGNLRVTATDGWYFELVKELMMREYTLRYSGGMVPDVNQIIKKGGGIFSYPVGKAQPQGKLRLLYECAPIAFLVEQAGGKAVAPILEGELDVMDLKIEEYHQRTPIFTGSLHEVEMALEYWRKRA